MVEVQNDVTEVEYPDAPGDYGEIFDYVVRKGPITHDKICDNTGWMSPNDIYSALQWCEDNGYVESMGGDLEEHGTTRTLYYVPANE
jgi:transcription initiation factor IIE alpha subunit